MKDSQISFLKGKLDEKMAKERNIKTEFA